MNNPLCTLLQKLLLLLPQSTDYEEDWGNLSITGTRDDNIFTQFRAIDHWLSVYNASAFANYFLDGDKTSTEDFDAYENNNDSFSEWKITLNKQGLLERKIQLQYYTNFFLKAENCKTWLDGIDPLEERNPINTYSPLHIQLGDGNYNFGSGSLVFSTYDKIDLRLPIANAKVLPSFDRIQEYVHFISKNSIRFNLDTFHPLDDDFSTDLANCFLLMCAKPFSVCITNEYYSPQNVVINGIKRINLALYSPQESVDLILLTHLVNLIVWLYTDRVETRLKLFNERLTLETNPNNSLLSSLNSHIETSFNQAKQRYNFVILERKDAYLKELKDLLKDLRTQSDLYSNKARTLLGNFLRDTLATLVLIGFTIFTKFSDNIGLDKAKMLNYVFSGLGIFLLISMAFQICVDVADLWITSKELKYWKKASNDLISDNEFETHYKKTLNPRKKSAYIIYCFISALYLSLAILCFNYPRFLKTMITTEQKIENGKQQPTVVKSTLKNK